MEIWTLREVERESLIYTIYSSYRVSLNQSKSSTHGIYWSLCQWRSWPYNDACLGLSINYLEWISLINNHYNNNWVILWRLGTGTGPVMPVLYVCEWAWKPFILSCVHFARSFISLVALWVVSCIYTLIIIQVIFEDQYVHDYSPAHYS